MTGTSGRVNKQSKQASMSLNLSMSADSHVPGLVLTVVAWLKRGSIGILALGPNCADTGERSGTKGCNTGDCGVRYGFTPCAPPSKGETLASFRRLIR